MLKRYDWFLFEFGKRFTLEVQKNLLHEIRSLKGPKDYRKRLVVAEIRDRGSKAWFAVVVRSQTLSESSIDSSNAILRVISRFPDLKGPDPVRDILQSYGPWTVDTIPYAPSNRVAAVEIVKVKPDEVLELKSRNMKAIGEIQGLMARFNIPFDTRIEVRRKLQVVEEFERWVTDLEFGLSSNRHPHWGPAIRDAQITSLMKIMRDRKLVAALTDPKFKQYRVKKHLRLRMNDQDVKNLEKFRRRLLRSM